MKNQSKLKLGKSTIVGIQQDQYIKAGVNSGDGCPISYRICMPTKK